MTIEIDGHLDQPNDDEAVDETPTSRRSLMSKAAIAAAVGAAAGITISNRAKAADGDAMLTGNAKTGTSTTQLSGGTTFRVDDGNSAGNASIYGTQSGTAGSGTYGVYGSYNGDGPTGVGVYGHHTDSENSGGTGVHGRTENTSGGTGVLGQSSGTQGYGVRGVALFTNAVGVLGQATEGRGVGVEGDGSQWDFSATGSGIVHLTSAIATDVGPTSNGSQGSIARNSDGSLWYCYAANSWQQLAPTTVFTPVVPFRAYDSREETDGRFAGDENRTVSVADAHAVDDYSNVTTNALPTGATAIAANVVAIQTTETGFLSINPGGTTTIAAAALNWGAGMNIGNAGIFRLNGSRQVEVVFGPGNGAHLTIDVYGYWS